jgi:hypothetical protein
MIGLLAHAMARGASLVVTDRRWGATLSACALGFGLFVGVAIGPGTAGTFATGPQQLIEIPSLIASGSEEDEGGTSGGGSSTPPASAAPSPAPTAESSSPEAFPSSAPLTAEPVEPPPPAEEPAPESTPPASEQQDEPETTQLAGTVVHTNPAAGSYALAIKGGELVPVHTAKLPRPGTKLSVEGVQLANGTFAEEDPPKRSGTATSTSFRGVVTFVDADPAAPAYTLSGRGASIPIQVPPDPTGAVPPLPAVGSYATVGVAIEQGAVLAQREIEVEPGEPSTYLDLSGICAGLSPETGQLLLSADDTRAGEQDLSLTVPAKIDARKLVAGDSYLATATIEPDGSLTLAGIASDEHTKGADDPADAQGDLRRRAGAG